jgi:hypothetical protein
VRAEEGMNRKDSGPRGFPSGEYHVRVILRISSWGVSVDLPFFLASISSFLINREAPCCLGDSRVLELRYFAVGLRNSDLKAVKDGTLLRCVVFAWVREASMVRSSAGLSR